MNKIEIVDNFYRSFRNGGITKEIFTNDYHFKGVIKGYNDMGRDEFVETFNKIAPLVKDHKILDYCEQDNKIWVYINFVSNPEEVMDTKFVDMFWIRDGKISRLETVFDPRAFFVLPQFEES